LAAQLNYAWTEVAIIERLFPAPDDLADYRCVLREITRATNRQLCDLVETMSYVYSDDKVNSYSIESVQSQSQSFRERLLKERNAFVYRNQELLLQSLLQGTQQR
jgi:hypothetical protein